MAFTEAQEASLLKIITAFEKGRRLSDLPNVTGTNPFGLYAEVLDTDGESKKSSLASLLPYMEEQVAYGVDINLTTGEVTRVGNMDLHRSLPVQSRIRGCLLSDEGKVNEYLNPLTWTNSVRDGSRGQVMNEIPMHYRKCYYPSATVYRVMMSEYPVPGYMQIPTMYCSAYEAALQRSTLKLASVVNTDADYRGGNNNAEWDGTYRSLIGMPASYISPTNFRTYARNRNGGDTQWNKLTYSLYRALYWLFVVEYATINSQAPYNPELTAEGFRQGGLGQGVTTLEGTKWSNYNNYHPFIPCGYTDEFGNGTGIKDFAMPAEYDPDATSPKVVSVARYRGIENPFGHLMKWVDGVNIMTSPTVEAGGDGLQHAYVCDDPAKFAYSVYGDPYRYVGALAANSGWIKKIHGGVYGDILPLEVGGGSTTFFCDYYSRTGSAEAVKHTVVALGGSAYYGTFAGLSCSYANLSPSTAGACYGSRLCFIPR